MTKRTRPPGARPTEDLPLFFEQTREALRRQSRVDAERAIDELEAVVTGVIEQLSRELEAVASATVRGVEWLEEEQRRVEELQMEYRGLTQRYHEIRTTLSTVEEERRAVADATVEAVLLMDQSEEELEALKQRYDGVREERQALADRAEALHRETAALAESNVEAVLLADQHAEMIGALETRAASYEEVNRDLVERVFVDELTGLFNHRYLRDQLGPEVARARRYKRALSLVFIDIDHFKRLNDTFGHQAGNAVLRQMGEMLSRRSRGADLTVRSLGNPFAARYGGEEFILILPETDLEGALRAGDRLRKLVEEQTFRHGRIDLGTVTFSAGVASLRDSDEQPNDLVVRADEALYQAKRQGRNRVCAAE